jgi:hypothetical protein
VIRIIFTGQSVTLWRLTRNGEVGEKVLTLFGREILPEHDGLVRRLSEVDMSKRAECGTGETGKNLGAC